ncbi:hypothetical protein LshimejAT787_1501070 [Lyophyllum shimeji]|uniref:DUF6532 domain-containing protein n=1 Tax=Lyophyllum shimeji TaxID=47721 RepID=A0A9P3PYK0_LYOSH|nr:hypothetical protein LshimejAT787_1501070 [Lyophyllum shimeji]
MGKNVNNEIVMSAPQVEGNSGSDGNDRDQSQVGAIVPKKRPRTTLAGLVDFPLTEAQKQRADVKLFRFIVHMNIAFSVTENWYFNDFLRDLRPLYVTPSRYVILHSIMDSEAARVRLEELERIQKRSKLTYLIDGWEDLLKRSLYGSVAAEVGQYPTVLSLEDMTGNRATAEGIMDATEKAMREMDLLDGRKFIAMTTDNPTVMQTVRRKFKEKYFWVLTFACFLHQLNTLIGEICAFPAMKKAITQATRAVTFFNSSHYWGGQVKDEAKLVKVTRGLKKNCKSRFYAITLLCNSVLENRKSGSPYLEYAAQKKTNGLSPVAADVVAIILYSPDFWEKIRQLLKFVKLIVDAIGNVEARDANLADCMLELLRCSKALLEVKREDGDDINFALHARAVFNRRFAIMDTDHHALALFLHPLCRKLAVSTAVKARPFEKMVKIALDIAKQCGRSPYCEQPVGQRTRSNSAGSRGSSSLLPTRGPRRPVLQYSASEDEADAHSPHSRIRSGSPEDHHSVIEASTPASHKRRASTSPSLRSAQAPRLNSTGGRPKAGDYDDVIQEYIYHAITLYRVALSTDLAFPSHQQETAGVRSAWKMVCDHFNEPLRLTPRIAKIITNRGSHLRSELKTKARPLVEAFFGFESGQNRKIIAKNRETVEWLKEHSRFVYKTSKTKVFIEDFQPFPIQALALVLSVIECCLDEWMTGIKTSIEFSSKLYGDIYAGHLQHIKEFQDYTMRNKACDLLESILTKLYNRGRFNAGAQPISTLDLPRISQKAFAAAVKEYVEDPKTDTDGKNGPSDEE